MELIDVVSSQGIELINGIRANLGATGTNATLKTSQSLRIEVTQEGTKTKMQLFGRPFFMTVETGRRPTPGKKPSREMISNISIWVEARGLPMSAVWAIATKIQASGTKLWKEGGREDIVGPAVDDFLNNVGQAVLDTKADELQIKIREMKW